MYSPGFYGAFIVCDEDADPIKSYLKIIDISKSLGFSLDEFFSLNADILANMDIIRKIQEESKK